MKVLSVLIKNTHSHTHKNKTTTPTRGLTYTHKPDDFLHIYVISQLENKLILLEHNCIVEPGNSNQYYQSLRANIEALLGVFGIRDI